MGIWSHIFAGAAEGGFDAWGKDISERQKKLEKEGLLKKQEESSMRVAGQQDRNAMARLKKEYELKGEQATTSADNEVLQDAQGNMKTVGEIREQGLPGPFYKIGVQPTTKPTKYSQKYRDDQGNEYLVNPEDPKDRQLLGKGKPDKSKKDDGTKPRNVSARMQETFLKESDKEATAEANAIDSEKWELGEDAKFAAWGGKAKFKVARKAQIYRDKMSEYESRGEGGSTKSNGIPDAAQTGLLGGAGTVVPNAPTASSQVYDSIFKQVNPNQQSKPPAVPTTPPVASQPMPKQAVPTSDTKMLGERLQAKLGLSPEEVAWLMKLSPSQAEQALRAISQKKGIPVDDEIKTLMGMKR